MLGPARYAFTNGALGHNPIRKQAPPSINGTDQKICSGPMTRNANRSSAGECGRGDTSADGLTESSTMMQASIVHKQENTRRVSMLFTSWSGRCQRCGTLDYLTFASPHPQNDRQALVEKRKPNLHLRVSKLQKAACGWIAGGNFSTVEAAR